jgi:uncharacterized surface protein with fasciclin (FAS1) repeats
MKLKTLFVVMTTATLLSACNDQEQQSTGTGDAISEKTNTGQSSVTDDESQKDIVKVAAGSKDHTTLVKAVQAADLVNALSNAGPFTVFAPTNAAFEKLPKGTVEGLLEPSKKEDLQNILQYHVSVGVFKPEMLLDGQVLGQVNGDNITISVKDGKIMVNGKANVVASIPASNGIIHVIDGVLLPGFK